MDLPSKSASDPLTLLLNEIEILLMAAPSATLLWAEECC